MVYLIKFANDKAVYRRIFAAPALSEYCKENIK